MTLQPVILSLAYVKLRSFCQENRPGWVLARFSGNFMNEAEDGRFFAESKT